MEAQTVRRRISRIAAHFAPNDDVSATHVLPMNCSSSLNSVVRRRDNKIYFARQGSASQASFMRPASIKEVSSALPGIHSKWSVANESFYNTSEPPLFSRPSRIEPNLPTTEMIQNVAQGSILTASDPPKFARPGPKISGEKQLYSKKKVHSSETKGVGWSPRMDIAESGSNYVITVEIPGVNIKDIRVEVDDQKLTVKGKRSTQFWKVESGSNHSVSTYHKREILQGPYEVVWPLPADVNKDSVSAEFLDGFLQIIIPKL